MLYPALRRQCVNALAFMLLGVLIEFLQGATGYRSFDVFDMVANAIGVLIGWVLVRTPLARVLGWVDGYLFVRRSG